MASKSLSGKVALVTGATRGIGKGIALQLSQAGAFVYVTGRTLKPKGEGAGGSLHETVEEMKARGGDGAGIQCDHSKDEDIVNLFNRIDVEQNGQLDILVNNAYSAVNSIVTTIGVPFWEQPMSTWDEVNNVGLRNHYLCTVLASQRMVPRKQGFIVNVSSAGGLRYLFNVPYGVGKEACDRMAKDCSIELKKHGVTFISLWPGAVRTEEILFHIDQGTFSKKSPMPGFSAEKMIKSFKEDGESTEFAGKCIVALASEANVINKTGRILLTSELAVQYGIYDNDGSQPTSIRSVKTGLLMAGGIFAVIAKFIPACIKLPYWIIHLAGNKF